MTGSHRAVDRPSMGLVIWRGLLRRCPRCGESRLFQGYLRQVDHCEACGERFAHIRSDDAAPWLTILVVGHLIVPLILKVEQERSWPDWASMTIWPILALLLVLLILPRAKSLFLSIIWATGSPGSESS